MLFWKKKNFTQSLDFIIVGLGNPGMSYENTRHNVGFMAIDYILSQCDSKTEQEKFQAKCCFTTIDEKKILLMKPSTFMNLSGEAVIDAMDFYKVPTEKIIVIFDDINIAPGKIRIKRKGSDGGHNGIKNIIFLTGQETFPRIKIGVGNKPSPQWDLADWVLSHFKEDDLQRVNEAIKNTYESVKLILSDKINEAMNKYNS